MQRRKSFLSEDSAKKNIFFKKRGFFPLFLFILLFFGLSIIFAQTNNQELECQTIDECKELLARYEKEIAAWETKLQKTQQEKNTLANKIAYLKQKIRKLDLEIKRSNVMINDLKLQIDDTQKSVNQTQEEVDKYKYQLAQLLRIIAREDKKSVIEIFLAQESMSDFFRNLVALEKINIRINETLKKLKNLKTSLEEQKLKMDREKEDLEKVLIIRQLQKEDITKTKLSQEGLLRQTKGKEELYQKYLAESKKKAAEIRSRIFELIGVAKAPTFGEAYEIAKLVSAQTGVRPAFLLAILTQESNIGKNVGQCYLKNAKTGSGIKITTGRSVSRVMKPKRDVPYFLQITRELDMDPYNTPVSCPMAYGWGGAMGPAQFIPSTWARYKSRLEKILGHKPNPWDIRDAFIAAALYLKDYGADKQTYSAEWRAAMIYFAGCTNRKYRFYGDSVIALTKKYEKDIQTMEKY